MRIMRMSMMNKNMKWGDSKKIIKKIILITTVLIIIVKSYKRCRVLNRRKKNKIVWKQLCKE